VQRWVVSTLLAVQPDLAPGIQRQKEASLCGLLHGKCLSVFDVLTDFGCRLSHVILAKLVNVFNCFRGRLGPCQVLRFSPLVVPHEVLHLEISELLDPVLRYLHIVVLDAADTLEISPEWKGLQTPVEVNVSNVKLVEVCLRGACDEILAVSEKTSLLLLLLQQ
jgi:hypothetical protein